MKAIVLSLLLACPCFAEVWVVTKKGCNPQMQPKKVAWIVTHKPSKVSKVCGCSSACTCGCNQGKECDCGKPKLQSPYRIVTPAESMSCTVGNG